MADLNSQALELAPDLGPAPSGEAWNAAPSERDLLAVVELLFFAYRDFTGDPDAMLAEYGLGRAHHRVLHFVDRNPGLRVADLLSILKITKQSLSRVLKQLIDDKWIRQRAGPRDRRERQLYSTPKGQHLARRLRDLQTARVADALKASGAETSSAIRAFLFAMIAEHERRHAASLLAGVGGAELQLQASEGSTSP